jgi:hypothetical protein
MGAVESNVRPSVRNSFLPDPQPRTTRQRSMPASYLTQKPTQGRSGASCLLGHVTDVEELRLKNNVSLGRDLLKKAAAVVAAENSDGSTTAATSCSEDCDLEFTQEYLSIYGGGISPQISQVRVVIFDWDDTLLPTSFLRDALRIYPARQAYSSRSGRPRLPRREERPSAFGPGFPCQQALEAHVALIREVLCAARTVAHVGIVTMAERPWVNESAEQYVPSLGLTQLLQELGIPVYYASEYRRTSRSYLMPDSSQPVCKRLAMEDYIKSLGEFHSSTRLNLLSIGDSSAEREAARQACASIERKAVAQKSALPLCKTIKMQTDPSLKMLSFQLKMLIARMGRMVAINKDIDLIFDAVDTMDMIEAKSIAAFGA